MNLEEAKIKLQLTTKKGLPIMMAGLIFWIIASISGLVLPTNITTWVYIIGVGCIFPLGIAIASLLKINLFAKGNPLVTLSGIIGGINMLNIPLILVVYFNNPSWLPFIVGSAAGAHFLPYMWIYDSKSYLFLSLGTVFISGLSTIWFLENLYFILPISLSIVYLITIISLVMENKKLIQYNTTM